MFYFDMPLHGSVQRCSAFDLLLLTVLSVLGDHPFLMHSPWSHMEAGYWCVCCMCVCGVWKKGKKTDKTLQNEHKCKLFIKEIGEEGGRVYKKVLKRVVLMLSRAHFYSGQGHSVAPRILGTHRGQEKQV